MPVTKTAKRALRVSRRRAVRNTRVRGNYKQALKKARVTKSPVSLAYAYHSLDIAAKKGVIHKRKAARLKSRLTKFLVPKRRKSKETVPLFQTSVK